MENLVSKQPRPWSDAVLYGFWSGSALFAYGRFIGFQVRLGENFQKSFAILRPGAGLGLSDCAFDI